MLPKKKKVWDLGKPAQFRSKLLMNGSRVQFQRGFMDILRFDPLGVCEQPGCTSLSAGSVDTELFLRKLEKEGIQIQTSLIYCVYPSVEPH